MASKAKQVGKGDIRRLMKETKTKVNSPLAKYNSAGQLTCVLCETVVKNELVWPAHANGKLHKDNVANLKSGRPTNIANGHAAAKRKRENGVTSAMAMGTSSSSSLPADFFEGASSPKAPKLEKLKIIPLAERKPAGILKNKKTEPSAVPRPPQDKTSVPMSSSTNGKSSHSISSSPSAKSSPSSSASLPSEFYDAPKDNEKRNEEVKDKSGRKKKEKDQELVSAEAPTAAPTATDSGDADQSVQESGEIPEGFFDDPVEDAKVHHKPYVDPLDAQWELFQKEIKMEAHKSEVIEEEDDDVMIYERTLAEIDDQLEGWAKVEALHVKKEAKFVKVEIKEEEEGAGAHVITNDAAMNVDVKVKIEPEQECDDGDVKKESDDSDDSDESDDDEGDDDDDFDELLDWRSKGT